MRVMEVFLANKWKLAGNPHNRAVPTLFMHIPKSSGIALVHALRRVLAPNRAIDGCFDRVLFGAFRDFDTLAAVGPGLRVWVLRAVNPFAAVWVGQLHHRLA
jgi:hypothetical protein